MKARWGSRTSATSRIRLNTRLSKMPPECLEHVIVLEPLHLLEDSHNARFKALLNLFAPGWGITRKALKGHKPARSNLTY
jgi:hypothetical protein